MYQIIPTILVQDRLEFVRRLGIIEGKIPLVQIDIIDGKFVKSITFADPQIAKGYKINYELDLKVEDPEPVLEKWHDTLPQPPPIRGGGKVVRAFIHAEIKKSLTPLFEKIKAYGWEAGITINPDTPWKVVESFLPPPQSSPTHPTPAELGAGQARGEEAKGNSPPLVGGVRGGGILDGILFMTVYPGQNGAPFQPKVIPKIKSFHQKYPDIPIAVDGGVNEKTLPQLLKSGVSRFAVGSAIWSAPNPIQAYKKLLSLISK